MPKSTWNPSEYATVAERVALFRAAYPFGCIITHLHARDAQQVTFKAEVYRHEGDPHPAATGWATEREGDGDINTVACLENTETSAIGRALANLGFSASKQRASFEEMLAADRRRKAQPDAGSLRLVRERPRAEPDASAPPRRDANPLLQDAAEAVLDVLRLVSEAEGLGLPAREARRHRQALAGRTVAPSVLVRVERELRTWFRRHDPAAVSPSVPGDTPSDQR